MNKMNKEKIVYIVHCIDTEGPLDESLKATFERLKHIYHLNFNSFIYINKNLVF